MNPADSFNSLSQLTETFPTEDSCRRYLESVRWEGKPVCPHCGSEDENHYRLKTKGEFKGLYKCRDCRERFTATVGTIFEGSHVPLKKWFIALYLFSAHKKGISSVQLASDLGVTQKTAWFMLGRMRYAFGMEEAEKMDGTVQADETYVGGKNKNRHGDKKKENTQGRSLLDKTPVFGVVSGDSGKVRAIVVPDTKAETLKPAVKKMVAEGSVIVTDEWGAYRSLVEEYTHVVVRHKENEYVRERTFHTNGIENFWSLLKRGLYGIYHQVSPKHLHRYCGEFAFRYNSRKAGNGERFDLALGLSSVGRLMYKELIEKV